MRLKQFLLASTFMNVFTSAIIFTTSAVFAMDENSLSEKMHNGISLTKSQEDKKCNAAYREVLALYMDQAEFHEEMVETLEKQIRPPNIEKVEKVKSKIKLNSNFEEKIIGNAQEILGLPLSTMQQPSKNPQGQEKYVKVEDVAQNIIKMHRDTATIYKQFVKVRKENQQDSPLKKIASIYCRATTNTVDTWSKVLATKNRLKQNTLLSEEQIEQHYMIKFLVDKTRFFQFVQKKILEEFEDYLEDILLEMVNISNKELKVDFMLTPKDKKFYESVKNKTYVFPKVEKKIVPEKKEDLKLIGQAQKEEKKIKTEITSEEIIPSDMPTEELENGTLPQVMQEENKNIENLPLSEQQEILTSSLETIEKTNDNIDKSSEVADLEKLKEQFEKQVLQDRKAKKKNIIFKKRDGEDFFEKKSIIEKATINTKHHSFLETVCKSLVTDQKIKWVDVVTLFDSPSGFKGKVHGSKNGSCNTFEVFLKFDAKGNLAEFLSEESFKVFKKEAIPELQEERNFLMNNDRLVTYRLSTSERISRSFFTLHNPHPGSYLYTDLLKRLKKQLALLGINHETVQSGAVRGGLQN